jgi:hypothetical protein
MNEGMIMEMNYHVLSLYDTSINNHILNYKKHISVKLFLKINDYGQGNVLKEYYFIIENDMQSMETKH